MLNLSSLHVLVREQRLAEDHLTTPSRANDQALPLSVAEQRALAFWQERLNRQQVGLHCPPTTHCEERGSPILPPR